ncbi:MAG TPA: pseudouridine synthase [Povalibacter sp.]|nr:pseudouridine synthase [Povalibacter sp.]
MRTRLPLLNGVAAATVQLPPGAWSTVLDCLAEHFPAIARERWIDRMARGRVLDEHGRPLLPAAAYKAGMRVHYYREVVAETPIPFAESVLHADEHLVVADKPHFLPVIPAGEYVRETLLTRLRQRLCNPDLVPLHRIDRGTAGLVLFSAQAGSRARYQALFRERQIAKRYEAIAPALPALRFPLTRSTRIVRGEPFVRSREAAGPANSETRIEAERSDGELWRYTLHPITGKKHQLRVHMAALGAPILNDDFYPAMIARASDDFSQPLQLLARSVSFRDPLTGGVREFHSRLELLHGSAQPAELPI